MDYLEVCFLAFKCPEILLLPFCYWFVVWFHCGQRTYSPWFQSFKIYWDFFFLAVLGLRFCARAFSSCGKWGPLFIAVRGLSLSRPLLLRSTGSICARSVVVAHGPSCSAACGIFPDQGSNPCPLHWQADSQPLRHQGSPRLFFYSHEHSLSWWMFYVHLKRMCILLLLGGVFYKNQLS